VDLTFPAYLHKKIRKNNECRWSGYTHRHPGKLAAALPSTQSGLQFYMDGVTRQATLSGTDLFEHSEKVYKSTVYKLNPLNALVNHSDSAAYHINVIADEPPAITVERKIRLRKYECPVFQR